MTLKLPQIIGHRGAAAYAPENTLEGIHTAADMGIEWVELDVKLSKDQVPMVFHDETLDRTTNGSGSIAEKTLEELRELECGRWFADSFTGIKIPTLEEAIEVLIDRDLGLTLDIKPCPGREKDTAEAALDVLSQYWDEADKLLITSFAQESMEAALDWVPDWHRGFAMPTEWPDNWAEMIKYLKASSISVNGNQVTQDQVQSVKEPGLPILAYVINDPDRARLLQSWGVTGMFSDEPDVVREGILSVH